MFTAEEATKERVDAYVAALETEIAGYEARIKRIELGRKDPMLDAGVSVKEAVDQVKDRIKQCKAEISRVRKQGSSDEEKPLEKWSVPELDAVFGELEGYPSGANKPDKVAFAKEHQDEAAEADS